MFLHVTIVQYLKPPGLRGLETPRIHVTVWIPNVEMVLRFPSQAKRHISISLNTNFMFEFDVSVK